LHALNEHTFAQVEPIERNALEFYETRAEPLLKQAAPERDAGAVKRAVAGLRREGSRLKRAEELLQKSGPFPSPQLERARRVRRRLFAEETKLFAESVRCLE